MTESNHRRWLWLTGLFLVLVLTACSSSSSAPASSAGQIATGSSAAQKPAPADTIVIKNFMFTPSSLTVAPGAVVTVSNEDSVTHTLTAKTDQKLFNTGPVSPGQTKTFKAPAIAEAAATVAAAILALYAWLGWLRRRAGGR